jgi:hypothetical protein
MKKVLLLFAALSIGFLVNAQTVENITVTPEDDKIIINFRIGGSANTQSYNVVLSCEMDGGPRFEPRSLKGDFGNNIRGGQPYYTIEWDVFRDVDQVGDAEFFVKVDLISDMSAPVTTPQNQPVQEMEEKSDPVYPEFGEISSQKEPTEWRGYFAYTGSSKSPLGISFGSLKKTGTYGSFRYGSDNTDLSTHIWGTIMAGFTRFIVHSKNYRLHGFLGVGITLEHYEYDDGLDYYDWDDSYFAFDLGLINTIGRLYLNLGLEFINFADENYSKVYPVFGVGFTF